MLSRSEILDEWLKRYMGFTSFRPGQREIVERIMMRRNVLGVLATGSGKSLTYQLPSLVLPKLTLVVTPLISLMIDQVQRLKTKGRHDAAYLNSSLSAAEIKQITSEIKVGKYKLVYISPEKLQQPHILALLKKRGVSLVAIDEAHCISQWGHDFRTDYLRLPQVLEELGNPVVLAVTATATQAVQDELSSLFQILPEDRVIQSLNRANIAYDVRRVESEQEKTAQVLAAIEKLKGPGIVYCSTRQAVENLVAACQRAGLLSVHGYHGGMNAMERILIQEQFLREEISVIIATNAFGMGIDKPNIRFVLHYHFPSSIEAYVQEVGRIGRDGLPGYACLFYDPADYFIHFRLLQNEIPTQVEVEQFIQLITHHDRKMGTAEITSTELQAWLGLDEQAQRMLFFYAEQTGIVQHAVQTRQGFQYEWTGKESDRALERITSRIEEVKQAKLAKLRSIQLWLEQNACLRKELQAYFGETLEDLQEQCCVNCGLDAAVYEKTESEELQEKYADWDLKTSLQKLFPGVMVDMREAGKVE